jgi:L-ascorbate metabolism protein UlaG (beta-lactamase superfamily)
MKNSHTFAMSCRSAVEPGTMRLTRLNIYSALYIEFARTRVLVDPSYVLPEVAQELCPDLILVSHESMDHFDAKLCLSLLSRPETVFIGSWGVMAALAGELAPDDSLWHRIHVGIPGAVFELGDLVVRIEEAQHCEYAVPIFFDLADANTGFRILNAIDSEITPAMENGGIAAAPDIFVVPLGIAWAASPSKAWQMVKLLRPRAVFASHFTKEADEFHTLARARYGDEQRLIVPDWYRGVTLAGPNPAFRSQPMVWMTDPAAYPGLEKLLPAGIYHLPTQEGIILEQLTADVANARSLSTALYFLACAALRGCVTLRTVDVLQQMRNWVLSRDDERLIAAYLLALGATAGAVSGAEKKIDLAYLKTLMSQDRSYLDYWILEAWGRAARGPAFRDCVIELLEEVAASKSLSEVVGVRRKLSWEIYHLLETGCLWPGLAAMLEKARADSNPDVRLLTYKTLAQCYAAVPSGPALLSAGLVDEHEDVLDWALRVHIQLFDALEPANRRDLSTRLPALLAHSNYHVRQKASALAELCGVCK